MKKYKHSYPFALLVWTSASSFPHGAASSRLRVSHNPIRPHYDGLHHQLLACLSTP